MLAPVAVDTAYSYRAPAGLKLEPGAFVRMPLGAPRGDRRRLGRAPGGGGNLKPIAEASTGRRSAQPMRDFIDWVARWTLSPRGMVLRMAIRAGEVAAPPAAEIRPRRRPARRPRA